MSDADKYRLVAEDLFRLCRRASYALLRERPKEAGEALNHAVRIASRVGIKESIIRSWEEIRQNPPIGE